MRPPRVDGKTISVPSWVQAGGPLEALSKVRRLGRPPVTGITNRSLPRPPILPRLKANLKPSGEKAPPQSYSGVAGDVIARRSSHQWKAKISESESRRSTLQMPTICHQAKRDQSIIRGPCRAADTGFRRQPQRFATADESECRLPRPPPHTLQTQLDCHQARKQEGPACHAKQAMALLRSSAWPCTSP